MFRITPGSRDLPLDIFFTLDDGSEFKIARTQAGYETTYLKCSETVSKMVISPFKNIEECYKQLKKYQTQGQNANGRVS